MIEFSVAYHITASIFVGSRFLVIAANRKASAAIRLAVLRQVAPCYWQIVHNPTTYSNYIQYIYTSTITLTLTNTRVVND